MISIQVSWEAPVANGASITGYQLFMSEQSDDFEMIYNGTARSDITSYVVSNNVKRSKAYSFKVIAINRIGLSPASDLLKSFAAVVPSVPLSFKHTNSESGSITLAWLPPEFDGGAMVTGYFIYYKIAGTVNWSKTSLISADNFQHTVDSLSADTRYSLKIVAVNEKGESEQSNIHYQYASAVPTGLFAPTLVVSSRTDTTLTIVMSPPTLSSTDVLGYQVYSNDANTQNVPSNLVYDGQAISAVLNVMIRDLESGQGYWLAYRVINRAGWSELSPYLSLIAGRLPSPPVQTPHQISVSPTAITFGWVPPTDIGGAAKLDGYNVYSGSSNLASLDPYVLEYTLDGVQLTAGNSYSIRISSSTAIGEGAQSNPLTIWAISLPDAPVLSRTDTSQDSCSV